MHLAVPFFMVCSSFLDRSCMYVNYVSYVVFPCFLFLVAYVTVFLSVFSKCCALVLYFSFAMCFSKKMSFPLQSALL